MVSLTVIVPGGVPIVELQSVDHVVRLLVAWTLYVTSVAVPVKVSARNLLEPLVTTLEYGTPGDALL